MDNAVEMLMAKTGRGFRLRRENKTKVRLDYPSPSCWQQQQYPFPDVQGGLAVLVCGKALVIVLMLFRLSFSVRPPPYSLQQAQRHAAQPLRVEHPITSRHSEFVAAPPLPAALDEKG